VTPADLLPLAREAASAAACVLLAERPWVLAEGPSGTKSSETDPVTRADVAAQQVIADIIVRARPRDAIFAEEGLDRPGDSGWRWVVDPLDGTVNFLYGIAQWSVSVAVRDEDGALAGVVHNPIAPETFAAVRGEPPTRNGVPVRSRAEDAPALAESLVATGFAYAAAVRAQQGAVVARLLPRVRDIRRLGSAALDLAGVAVGRYDAYFERGVKPWDTTAGELICVSAGLAVRAIPDGILVAPPALADELESIVAGC